MEPEPQESARSRVVELSLAAGLEVLQNPAKMVVFEGTGKPVEVDLSSPGCARQTSANSTGVELTFQNETGDWCGWRLPLDRVDGVYLDEDHGVLWFTGSGGQRKLGTGNYQDLPGRQGVAINVAQVAGANQALVIEKMLDAAVKTQRPDDRLNFTVKTGKSAVDYVKRFVGRGVQIKKLDDGALRSGARQVGAPASVAEHTKSPHSQRSGQPTMQRVGSRPEKHGRGLVEALRRLGDTLAHEIPPGQPESEVAQRSVTSVTEGKVSETPSLQPESVVCQRRSGEDADSAFDVKPSSNKYGIAGLIAVTDGHSLMSNGYARGFAHKAPEVILDCLLRRKERDLKEAIEVAFQEADAILIKDYGGLDRGCGIEMVIPAADGLYLVHLGNGRQFYRARGQIYDIGFQPHKPAEGRVGGQLADNRSLGDGDLKFSVGTKTLSPIPDVHRISWEEVEERGIDTLLLATDGLSLLQERVRPNIVHEAFILERSELVRQIQEAQTALDKQYSKIVSDDCTVTRARIGWPTSPPRSPRPGPR